MFRQDVADRIRVTGLERHQCRVDHAFVFPSEFLGDNSFQLLNIEIKNFSDEAEDENIFAFVLGRAAERFHGKTGDRHADVKETFIVEVRLDVVRVVKQDAAFSQEADVILVTVLIKRDQKIGFVPGR